MESALYGIYALVVFVSEISLVRFLIRQQLVRKYRTPALSMKYSLHSFFFTGLEAEFKVLAIPYNPLGHCLRKDFFNCDLICNV